MKKLTIAIDCDDVIVPTAPMILKHYNETYGTKIELKDFYSSDLSVWGVSDMSLAVQRVEAYTRTEECQNVSPFVEAIEVIRELGKYHDLHIVTGRADFLAPSTKDMLARHFPDMFKSVQFTNFFGSKPRPKAEVCRELNADYLIEDNLHHASTVAACGINVLLFGDYLWNHSNGLPDNVKRVRGWREVGHLLIGSAI